ncbi:hypothetical protein BDR26DRAFT_850301 [Obelidium mucronatum]|nr:hypothetical protein BDR26DRAFT_850301 [Obelidium mucronatum]
MADTIVFALVQLLIVAIKRPERFVLQPGKEPVANATTFISVVHDLAPLRWLLFAVLSLTADVSLIHLHNYYTERLNESGNPIFENLRDLAPLITSHPILARINECLNFLGATTSDHLADSLKDFFFNTYASSIVKVTSGIRIGDQPRMALAYLLTSFHLSPQTLSKVVQKFRTHLKENSSVPLYKIILLETLTCYSQYKSYPIPSMRSLVEVGMASLDALLKTNAALLSPVLCDLFLILEEFHSEASAPATPVEVGWIAGGLVKIVNVENSKQLLSAQSSLLLMRMIDLIQDWYLKREKEGATATISPNADFMASFSNQIKTLVSLVSTRCDQHHGRKLLSPQQATAATPAIRGNSSGTSVITHLVLLLELMGLSMGKQAAVDIFSILIKTCKGPILSVPLDPMPLSQGDIGDVHSVHVIGSLRLAWKQKEVLSDAYRKALEGIFSTAMESGGGELSPVTVSNLWHMVLVKDEQCLHMERDGTTSAILARYWKELLLFSIPKTTQQMTSKSNSTILLHTLQETIPIIAAQNQPTASSFLPTLIQTYFHVLKEYLTLLCSTKHASMNISGDVVGKRINDLSLYMYSLSDVIARTGVVFSLVYGGMGWSLRGLFDMIVTETIGFELFLDLAGNRGGASQISSHNGVKSGDMTPVAPMEETTCFREKLRGPTATAGVASNAAIAGGMARGSMVVEEEPGIVFVEKKAFAKQNSDVMMKLKAKTQSAIESSEWTSSFQGLVTSLISNCVESQGSPAHALLYLAETVQTALQLRPFDSAPTVLPYLAQSTSDNRVLTLFKTHKILWDLLMLIAEDRNAYIILKEVVRVHCLHLLTFWKRNSSVSNANASKQKSIAIELETTSRLIHLISKAHELGSRGSDCVLLLPLIEHKDIVLLVEAFWNVAISEWKQGVSEMDVSSDGAGNGSMQWTVSEQSLRKVVCEVTTRNIVSIGPDLACLFLM